MKEDASYLALLAIFIFPSLGGFLFGWDIGATSYVLTQLTGDAGKYAGVEWSATLIDSSLTRGLFTSSVVAGALLGVIIVFRVEKILGRRKELLLAAFFYIIGGSLEFLSSLSTLGKSGLGIMLLGRWIYGLGVGCTMHGAPSFISEMCPASVRGLFIAGKEAIIVLGILIGSVIGFVLRQTIGGWRWTYGVTVLIGAIMMLGMTYLPPSARWLALHGRFEEAEASLKFFLVRGAGQEMDAIIQNCDEIKSRPRTSVFQKKYLWQITVGLGAVCLQQITGQPSVLYYANEIFKSVHLADEANLGVGAFKLVATLGACVYVDKFGRRRLLMVGIALMLAALIALSGSFFGYNGQEGQGTRDGFIIASFFVYIGGYQVGFGPVSWILVSEIFPLEVRGQMVSLAVSTNFFFNLVVTFLFDPVKEVLGTSLTFLCFAIIDALALLFVCIFVPETKGLSLEEIERLFAAGGRRGPCGIFPTHRAGSSPNRLQIKEIIERLLPVGRGDSSNEGERSLGNGKRDEDAS